jgi:hypothetical protein
MIQTDQRIFKKSFPKVAGLLTGFSKSLSIEPRVHTNRGLEQSQISLNPPPPPPR